jgi:hypothetical protein
MRRPPLALLSCALATATVACASTPEQGVVNNEDPLTSENGLTSNGLTSNGLTSNGLTSNGLTSNGLSTGSLSSNAVVMTALRDQTPTGDLSRLFFRYLVSCALPTGHSVSYTWTDSSSTMHTEIDQGALGLAPNWENGAPSQADKELVSACLAARTNSKGVTVPISMRAKGVSALSVTTSERSQYSYGEGSFWGNLFASTPYAYSCSRSPMNYGASSTSQYLASGRTCTTSACGIITPVGPCLTSDAATSGQACYEHDASYDWSSKCNSSKLKSATSSDHVISTWLMP